MYVFINMYNHSQIEKYHYSTSIYWLSSILRTRVFSYAISFSIILYFLVDIAWPVFYFFHVSSLFDATSPTDFTPFPSKSPSIFIPIVPSVPRREAIIFLFLLFYFYFSINNPFIFLSVKLYVCFAVIIIRVMIRYRSVWLSYTVRSCKAYSTWESKLKVHFEVYDCHSAVSFLKSCLLLSIVPVLALKLFEYFIASASASFKLSCPLAVYHVLIYFFIYNYQSLNRRFFTAIVSRILVFHSA